MQPDLEAKTVPLMKLLDFPRLPWRALVAMLWLGLSGAGAWAERADRDKPMNIEADAMRYEDQKQLSTFTGRVVVTKGTIVMRGARMEVKQDDAGNQNGTMWAAPGQRAFFRQKREGVDEYIEGEADTIYYDGKADVARFVGHAEMRRLGGTQLLDQTLGSVIVYNNVTEVYTVDGPPRSDGQASAAPGGRVRATLAPRNTGAPAAPATAPGVPLRPSTSLPAGASR